MNNIEWCGFLGKFEDGTFELWAGSLTEDEKKIICEIVKSHETDGTSVRGKAEEISVSEVF